MHERCDIKWDPLYLEVPTKLKLVKEAVPGFLPDCPPRFSSSTKQRFDRALKEQELTDTAIDQSLLQYHVDKELFKELVSKTKQLDLPNHWIIWSSDDISLNLIKPSKTVCSLTITKSLHTIGFYERVRLFLSLPQIHDISGVNLLLKEVNHHSQAATSVISVETFQQHVREATAGVHKAIGLLSPSIREDSGDQPVFSCLEFILWQLENF